MANDLTANPWIVDTASATALTADLIRVAKFRWVGATTAGHECKVTATDTDRVIFRSLAAGANHIDEQTHENEQFNTLGIIVVTLTSGILYIYYK
jgi:hypothetical protein